MTEIATTELPGVITEFLTAHNARDVDGALARSTEDISITDEGRTYRGRADVAAWMRRTAGEYTYTIELVAADRIDDDHYLAVHHLEGDFPGAVVDLRFDFALRDGRVAELTIAP